MKGSTTRPSHAKKSENGDGDAKTSSKLSRSATAKTSGTTSKSTLSRSKTDMGAKKTTKGPTTKSKLGGTDDENVPSYMRPTRSSTASHNEKGSTDVEPPKKKGVKKPLSGTKAKTGTGTKPTRPKKAKSDSSPKEKKVSLEPSVDTPTPEDISTEQAVDASATVSIAPQTPSTPGHDPAPHTSDNDSAEVKDAVQVETTQALHPCQETTVELKEDPEEETEEVEQTEAVEEFKLQTEGVEAPDGEHVATTEVVVESNDTEEEAEIGNEGQGVQQNEDPSTIEASANQTEDPPITTDCTEVLQTEEASESLPTGVEVDPGTEATVEVKETTEEQVQENACHLEEGSPEVDPQQEQTVVKEETEEASVHDPEQTTADPEDVNTTTPVTEQPQDQTEEAEEVSTSENHFPTTENEVEVGADPQEEETQPPVVEEVTEEAVEVEHDDFSKTPVEVTESEKQSEDPIPAATEHDEQKESTSGESSSEHKAKVVEASAPATKTATKGATKGRGRKQK